MFMIKHTEMAGILQRDFYTIENLSNYEVWKFLRFHDCKDPRMKSSKKMT